MLSVASGYSATNTRKTAASIDTRPDGVVRGFIQRTGVDYGETYCPVVKSATVRTVLHLAAQRD